MRAQDPPCPWDKYVCHFAAQKGHLEVLRWARSQGCPWDEDVPRFAARNGQLKVLKWLINEGCPYDKRQCLEAAEYADERLVPWELKRKVLQWLENNTSYMTNETSYCHGLEFGSLEWHRLQWLDE